MGKKKQKLKKQGKLVDFQEQKSIKRARSRIVTILPRNSAQEEFVTKLNDESKRVVFAIGPAGTGKTMLSVKKAIRSLLRGKVERIILTRPAVSVEEKHGYLPGDINEKMAPWVKPIMDVFEEHFTPTQIDEMMEDGVIEISPLAYMRGRTFKNAIIVFDEAQNSTESQMKTVLTRIGEGSRMFITGDLKQSDFNEKNGLNDFFKRHGERDSDMIAQCQFDLRHVERDPVVSEILKFYGEE